MGTLRVFGGALTHFLCKLRLRFFSPPWGGRCTHCTPWLRLCKLRPCLLYYFALRRRRGIKQSCDPSVCLSVCLPHASRAKTVHSRHMVTERPWPWEICVVKVSKTKKKYRLPIICNNHRHRLITGKDRSRLFVCSAHLSTVNCRRRSIPCRRWATTFVWIAFIFYRRLRFGSLNCYWSNSLIYARIN